MNDPSRGSSDPDDSAPILPFARPEPPLGAKLGRPEGPESAPVIEDPYLKAERERTAQRDRERGSRGLLRALQVLVVVPILLGSIALIYREYRKLDPLPPAGAAQEPSSAAPPPEPSPGASQTSASPSASGSAAQGPLRSAPRETRVTRAGRIPVIDLGTEDQRALEDSLRAERAAAQAEGRVLLVMTVQYKLPQFRDLDAALFDPLLQEALSDVRLVRVDATHFDAELNALGVPTHGVPWIVLLGADLVPRDGIDGGEWDEDVARNIAPVLGAFAHGTLKKRRHAWTPPRSKGVQL